MKFLLILAFVCVVVQSQANGMNQVETDVEDSIRQKRSPFGNVKNGCTGTFCSNNQQEIQRGKRSSFGNVQNHCDGTFCSNNQQEIQRGKRSPGNVENYCVGPFCSNNQYEIQQRGKRSPFGQIKNVCVGTNCCNGFDCPNNEDRPFMNNENTSPQRDGQKDGTIKKFFKGIF
uniref:Uncharacterized protein n=1 Tax=Acrobeloides nanus TaxID=290746 RepID=A0A914BYW6_9BILA